MDRVVNAGGAATAFRATRAGLVALAAAVALTALPGCAMLSHNIVAKPGDPATYRLWDCERLFDESDQVQQRAADVAYAVDARVGNNMIALGIGVVVFWPALLAMRTGGPEAAELAELKGRFEAMQQVQRDKACGPPPTAMQAQRAATLPVAMGDRLVYDDRPGNGPASGLHGTGSAQAAGARELGLRVVGLRRDALEFEVDVDGRPVGAVWRQDLAGNVQPPTEGAGRAAPLLRWQRLLRSDLVLGQVLDGELFAPEDASARARVRGQVVATGPQQLAGRSFDVAVIELFGDAPNEGSQRGRESGATTRLDGVMAVDRGSGVLLRLELRCGNADFAVRRRLLRVESAASQ